jgi:hypothetical protein
MKLLIEYVTTEIDIEIRDKVKVGLVAALFSGKSNLFHI